LRAMTATGIPDRRRMVDVGARQGDAGSKHG
jgi:hypothetical protein